MISLRDFFFAVGNGYFIFPIFPAGERHFLQITNYVTGAWTSKKITYKGKKA